MDAHILIVENEPDIANIVRRFLEFEGLRVEWVDSCGAARELCAAQPPDLILLDWKLPDIDGDRWVVELRAQLATAGIPVIMMTGGYPTPTLLAQMAAEHIPILIKPFSLDYLLELIERLIPRERAIGGD